MIKKLKKWRDNLTVSQAHKIMWRVGIITETIITLSFILNWKQITKNLQIPIGLFWLMSSVMMIMTIELGIVLVLGVEEKELNLEMEETTSKLKEDKFTEIYLKRGPRCDVSKIILDGYDAHEKRYFAKKEEDGIYVIMKEADTIIKDYHIRNCSFFDYHFTFTKEEK